MSIGPVEQLTAEGVSLWIDGLDREQLDSGALARLVGNRLVRGAVHGTAALADTVGDARYACQLTDLAARGVGPGEALRALIAHDLRRACDVLRPVHESGPLRDGLVSVDLPPVPASAVLAECRSLWWAVDRPNLLVRIAPTPERLPAVAACLAEGIGVDVGPVFSAARYAQVLEAFLDGLERALAAGRDPGRLNSVASFPLGPLDEGVARWLQAYGVRGEDGQEHAVCTATARLAYQLQEERFTTERWHRLAAAGARPQRLVWTATAISGRAGPDTRHVDGFVGWGVVSAVTPATLDALGDHALLAGDTLSGRQFSARRDLEALAALGVDLEALARTLEDGAQRAALAHWDKALVRVGEELALLRA